MTEIILPSVEEIIEINRSFGGKVLKPGSLEFLITKAESRKQTRDQKKHISEIAPIFWHDIVSLHPFLDGNKRTATETTLFFLYKNGFALNATNAGVVYTSLKVANGDLSQKGLAKWIYSNLKEI